MSKLDELLKILEGASHHVVTETIIHAAHIIAPELHDFPTGLSHIQHLALIGSQLTDAELIPIPLPQTVL